VAGPALSAMRQEVAAATLSAVANNLQRAAASGVSTTVGGRVPHGYRPPDRTSIST